MSDKDIKDSGERTVYPTGAVRDLKSGKGRWDLVDPRLMLCMFDMNLSLACPKNSRPALLNMFGLDSAKKMDECAPKSLLASAINYVLFVLCDSVTSTDIHPDGVHIVVLPLTENEEVRDYEYSTACYSYALYIMSLLVGVYYIPDTIDCYPKWTHLRTEIDNQFVISAYTLNLMLQGFSYLSKHYEKGMLKYGENNWVKGIPSKSFYDSAVRHLVTFLNNHMNDIEQDEPHLEAAMFNIAGLSFNCRRYDVDDPMREITLAKQFTPTVRV